MVVGATEAKNKGKVKEADHRDKFKMNLKVINLAKRHLMMQLLRTLAEVRSNGHFMDELVQRMFNKCGIIKFVYQIEKL